MRRQTIRTNQNAFEWDESHNTHGTSNHHQLLQKLLPSWTRAEAMIAGAALRVTDNQAICNKWPIDDLEKKNRSPECSNGNYDE